MLHRQETELGAGRAAARPFRWIRTVATAFSIVFLIYACWGLWINFTKPPGIDFVSFWAAGRLAGWGAPANAYNVPIHRLLEQTAGAMTGLMPFPYPPPFLLFVLPFGLLPFIPALATWVAATAALYSLAFRRIAPWPYTFAHPACFSNALVGQNGMLTSAIFAGGFTMLDRRPLIAGATLGLLIIKPQLAVLIPVALLAGGYWRAAFGAAASALAMLVLAWLAFGWGTYEAFSANAAHQATLVSGRIPWPKIASVFGALRTMGVPVTAALVVHAAIAIAGAAATWIAWARNLLTRVPVVAAATLLVSPYLLGHDSVLMMVPMGWLVVNQRRPLVVVLLWALSILAAAAIGPNPTPLAAIIAIAVMFQEGSLGERTSPENPTDKTRLQFNKPRELAA